MSRESVAWVTAKPRRRSLRRSSSWFVTRELASRSRIALWRCSFMGISLVDLAGSAVNVQFRTGCRILGKSKARLAGTRPRLYKYTTEMNNYAKRFCRQEEEKAVCEESQ